MSKWWQEPFRIFQTNLREIDAGLDVEATLDALESYHASCWLLNAGGIVSQYPSKLPFQHPSPWLAERPSGDLLGDAVEAAHRRGIKVIARCDFSKLHADQFEAHPDWFFVNADGKHQVYNGLYSACPSGPYNQEHSFDILAEILDGYRIDGLFFNMFGFAQTDYSGNHHGVCHCRNCSIRFRDQYGHALPRLEDPSDPELPDYQAFKRRTSDELAGRLQAFISERRPDVGLVLYAHAGDGDVAMFEVNNGIRRPLPYWTQHTGEVCRRSEGTRPGVPVTVNSVLFLDIPYRYHAEQPGIVGLRFAQTLAHGANPYAYVLGTTEQPDRSNLDTVREIFALHKKNADDYRGLVSAADTLLVQPGITEARLGGEGGARDAFRGFYRVLTQNHEQFDILPDAQLGEALKDGRLGRYGLIILPNCACLPVACAAAIDDFARRGGHVVATGQAGAYDERGQLRETPALGCLGVEKYDLRREDMRGAYLRIRPEDRAAFPALDHADHLAVVGTYFYALTGKDCERLLALSPPMRYGPPEKCHENELTEWPGVIRNQFGEGSSVLVPWEPDRQYYRLCLPAYSTLLASLVRAASPGEKVADTNGGPQVEIVVRDQKETQRRVIHLINYSGENGRSFFEPVSMHDITVRVAASKPYSRARSAMLEKDVPIENQNGGVSFVVPRLGLFDKIVLE